MNKRILFINLYFEMGGVETFLLRLIKELRCRGFESTVLLLRKAYDPELMSQLEKSANVVFLSDLVVFSPSAVRSRLGSNFDYIFSTINYALILGALLQQFVYKRANLLAGVYQTELFCPPVCRGFRHHEAIRSLFLDGVPDRNKIFGNDAAKAHHEILLERYFPNAPVVPLMIDAARYYPPERSSVDRKKIVSVGRLCDFKTYNFTMLDVLLKLKEMGHDLKWHIYGDGPERDRLQSEIIRLELSDFVFLHGQLDYSRFKEVVSGSLVFIGSGTAVMEAAACGVPSIPAIEYADTAESYGFLHEIPSTSFFEPNLSYPKKSILDLLLILLSVSNDEYEEISKSSILRIQPFSPEQVVDSTIKALVSSEYFRVNGLKYMIPMLFWRLLSKKFGV